MASAHVLIPLELKYCERCGGLWLRLSDTSDIYCADCLRALAEFPQRPRRVPAAASAKLALLPVSLAAACWAALPVGVCL